MNDPSGWLWAIVDIAGAVVLGAALAYAIWVWRGRRKDPAIKQKQAEIVREHYRHNE